MGMGADGIEVTHEPERLGPYLLLDRVGAGGMAEGYRAVKFVGDTRVKVFLKRIRREHRLDPDYVRWFQREAAIVASLRHANIVTLVEVDPDGRFLAFELIDGLDLRHLLRGHPDRRLPVDLSVLILTEVLKALDHAHSRTSGGAPAGVIHRDLDPSNVLISYAGEVKVADFGVSAFISPDGEPLTSIVGKPHYQAPEETRNDGAQNGRSDLFSLGVVAYQMLSGERPFTGSRAEIARAIAANRYVPLQQVAPNVPASLAAIVERLMKPDPTERFASALECQHAIYEVYAPNPMLYRDLGHLAYRARPHETIETSRVRALAERASLLPQAPTTPASSSTPAAVSGTQHVNNGDTVETEDPPTAKAEALVEEAATAARRARRRGRVIGGLSVGLITTACLIAAARLSSNQERPRPTETATTAVTASPEVPPPPSPSVAPPTAGTEATAAIAAPVVTLPSAAPLEAAPAEPAQGSLRVGAVPQSQIWVDGRLIGWSPRTVSVPAGQHTVSIGRDNLEDTSTRRAVSVAPGRTQRVGF